MHADIKQTPDTDQHLAYRLCSRCLADIRQMLHMLPLLARQDTLLWLKRENTLDTDDTYPYKMLSLFSFGLVYTAVSTWWLCSCNKEFSRSSDKNTCLHLRGVEKQTTQHFFAVSVFLCDSRFQTCVSVHSCPAPVCGQHTEQ